MLLNALRRLRSIFISIPLILAGTIVAATLGIAAKILAPHSGAADSIKRAWARAVLAAAFVRLRVEGRDHLPSGVAALYVSNHLSYLDPPALIAALRQPSRFLAKESLFAVPFLGWAMRAEGDIPIDRANPHAAARSLRRAEGVLAAGISCIAFPEGSRSPNGALQPFLSGAFRLATRAGVPVIPVAIAGSREALVPGSLFPRGGVIHVRFAPPVFTAGTPARSHEELASQVRREIERMISERMMSARTTSARCRKSRVQGRGEPQEAAGASGGAAGFAAGAPG